ncbi:unnamed protein product [Caenorhabditis angaria]|uniref:Uncharacterized protein n=1 Tax=Caenorhabditis angaria TaxID=860376 RepID=A0A9P1MYD1_9PELO|nr:unnamed protein product [Caenorhabditis angaria]
MPATIFGVFAAISCAPVSFESPQNFFNHLDISKIDDSAKIKFCNKEEIGKNSGDVHNLFEKSYNVILSDGKTSGTVEILDSSEVFYFKLSDDGKNLVQLLAMC